jgi:hypothetical protein
METKEAFSTLRGLSKTLPTDLRLRPPFCYCSSLLIRSVIVVLKIKAPQTASPSSRSLDAPAWPGAIAPAPLLPGENEAEYAELTAKFLAAVKPRDFIEEILARDAIDLTWEILRQRRMKAGLLRMASGEAVRRVTEKLAGRSPYNPAVQWMSGDRATRIQFENLLTKAGLSMEDVMAEALSINIDVTERIDRMLASNEARRNNALREIDRHRETLGSAVRQAIEEVEDAAFSDVETGEAGGLPVDQ